MLTYTRELGERQYLRGFAHAERRGALGGLVDRGWEPHQPSSTWGTQYEHWKWGGSVLHAESIDLLLAVDPARPSRVDVAFDVRGRKLNPRALRRHVRRCFPRRATHLADGDHSCTLYVGAASSDKRVVVYDKGVEWLLGSGYDPNQVSLSEEHWRVELRLYDDPARAWWDLAREDLQEAYRVAAGHVLELAGIVVGEPVAPRSKPKEEPEVVGSLFALIDQHASLLAAAAEAGVDVAGLAQERLSITRSRMAGWRHRRRVKDLVAEGRRAVEEGIRRLMHRRTYRGVLASP